MKKSGIIYPDPDSNDSVFEPAIGGYGAVGSVIGEVGLNEEARLQNEGLQDINSGIGGGVGDGLTGDESEAESASELENLTVNVDSSENEFETGSMSETGLGNVTGNTTYSENSTTKVTKAGGGDNINKSERNYSEKSVVNNITNNYSANRSGSDFGVRTFRDAGAQQDNTKKILESLKKSPYGTPNQNSRKFSSDKDNDFSSSKRDNNGSDTARDLLTVSQINSRKFSSSGSQNSNDKSNNNDTARDLLTVSQINSKRSGKNMDVGKELKKLNEKRGRIRKRRSEKEEKGESKLLNLMFIFEIFRWFSGSDIIVRFIIGAIAGIAGFGIIFTSMGLLDNL